MPSGTRPLPGPLSLAVAHTLSTAIRDRGRAQAEVAAAADMSASQLSRALSGQKVFTLDQLDAVCAAIGLDLVTTLGDADRATRTARRPDNVVTLRPNVGGATQNQRLRAVARDADPEPTDEQPSYDDPN